MPRKQNGFGSSASFAFKGSGRVDKGKSVGSFGQYPSDRRYGTTVVRTLTENWNLNSNWSKWRKGYELYNRAAYSIFNVINNDYNPGLPTSNNNPQYVPAELKSLLYQGTPYEIETTFTAIEMPTLKSDVNVHYVVKRQVSDNSDLGIINARNTTQLIKEQQAYNEVWFKGVPAANKGRLLLQMLNERLTDGETEATLKNVLTHSTDLDLDIPAVYKGKTPTSGAIETTNQFHDTTVKLIVPLNVISATYTNKATKIINQGLSTYEVPAQDGAFMQNPNLLIGKIVYIQDFFVEKPIEALDQADWNDYTDYFTLDVVEEETGKDFVVLDPGVSVLPPSMYDIATLPSIFSGIGNYTIKGTYAFLKEEYQRYFGRRYLTDELVRNEVEALSYSVFPFTILGAAINGQNLELVSVPFKSEIKLYADINDGSLVFADNSFIKYVEPSSAAFTKAINTNVDPWMDEVFTSGNELHPAEVFTCDCASYSRTILAMPEATEDGETRKNNRQMRYPLPTAQGPNRFENLGINKVAGKASSWATNEYKSSFKMCKHTVAGMFVDGVQLIEPSQYPTEFEREIFDKKLEKELDTLGDAWRMSAERSGISLTEIVFSLSQGLNLDDVETGYVVLNSN